MKRGRKILLKPLLHPPCYQKESPMGYMIRLSVLNGFPSCHWLLRKSFGPHVFKNTRNIYTDLAISEWTHCSLYLKAHEDFLRLPSSYLLHENMRYCSLCLRENSYYRLWWQLSFSGVCTEHKIWLRDTCHKCRKLITVSTCNMTECSCGADLRLSPIEYVSEKVLRLHHFLEGIGENETDENMVLFGYDNIIFYYRMIIIGFFFRWTELRVSRYPKYVDGASNMKYARNSITDIADALFFGASGFEGFIQRVHDKSRLVEDGEGLMSKFYFEMRRDFLKYCSVVREDETSRVFISEFERYLSRTRRNNNEGIFA